MKEQDTPHTTPPTDINQSVSPLILNWVTYKHYLDYADMTEDQKRQMIEALWDILTGFVRLGFGIDPSSQALDRQKELTKRHPQSCGKPPQTSNASAFEQAIGV